MPKSPPPKGPGWDPLAYLDATAEPGKRYTYHVTAVDRLWNESNPSPPHVVN